MQCRTADRPQPPYALVQYHDWDRDVLRTVRPRHPDPGRRRVAGGEDEYETGTMPTDGALFILYLLVVIVMVTLLQHLPALALGPLESVSH
jgi:hypothetical protein